MLSPKVWKPRDWNASDLGIDYSSLNVFLVEAGATTADIDAAWTAATVAGGVVQMPATTLIYSGVGLSHNSGPTSVAPVCLRGFGNGLSRLTFAAVTNAECIRISSQAGIGTGFAQGGGVIGLSITAQTTKDIIVINGIQGWLIDDVYTVGGRHVFTISESRDGLLHEFSSVQFTGDGIKIIGETYASNRYENGNIDGTSSTGYGVRWSKTGATDTGKVYFRDVNVHAAGIGAWLFETGNATPTDIFIWLESCVGEGAASGDAFWFRNVANITLTDCWGFTVASNGRGFKYDNARHIDQKGGTAYASGAGGSDFYFANACDNIDIAGVKTTGTVMAYGTDATTHTRINIDNPSTFAPVISNDLTKLQSYKQARCLTYTSVNVLLTSGVEANIAFDTNVRDHGPIHNLGTPTRLVAPVTGEYRVSAALKFDVHATGVRRVRFYKNPGGSILGETQQDASATAETTLPLSTPVFLTAGEYVTVAGFQTAGVGLNVIASTATVYNSWASMEVTKAW